MRGVFLYVCANKLSTLAVYKSLNEFHSKRYNSKNYRVLEFVRAIKLNQLRKQHLIYK